MDSCTPSVALNEKSFFFGLEMNDLVALSLTLILCQKLGLNKISDVLPVVITGACAFLLIPIRMKYRRKIIRDFVKFWSSYGIQCFLFRL
jgi:positive regulator of sigma E activity